MKPRGKPFEKGADARRNARGQRNKAAVAFSKTLRELIVAEGEKALTLQDGKRIKKVNAMVRQLWAAAIQGEAWAVQYISERVEGKVTQPVAFSNMTDAELREFIATRLAGHSNGAARSG